MVASIGFGLLALSVFFSARIARLRMHTVSEMLSLRYGDTAGVIAGVVMWIYTLMLAVTCTIAYASVFDVLFDVPRWLAVVIGGVIVAGYSALGGMWSITLTDMVQFVVKSIGVVLLLLPVAVVKAGGFVEMADKLPTGYLSPTSIGGQTIFTYGLIYTFGMLIGQDIWQRVFTARRPRRLAGRYRRRCLLPGLRAGRIGHRGGDQGSPPEPGRRRQRLRHHRGAHPAHRCQGSGAGRRTVRDDVHRQWRTDRLRHGRQQRHLGAAEGPRGRGHPAGNR